MKLLFKKLILFTLAVFAFFYTLQLMIDRGLRKVYDEEFAIWNKIYHGDLEADILYLGNSRTFVHFNPEIVQKITGLKGYNLGIDGGDVAMQKAKWDLLTEKDPLPKIIIQTADVSLLAGRKDIFMKHQFLPYLNEIAVYDPLRKKDEKIWTDRYIPLWKYHGYRYLVIKGIKSFFNLAKYNSHKDWDGYNGKDLSWTSDFDDFKKSLNGKKVTYSDENIREGLAYLDSLIVFSKNHKIELVFVFPPQYYGLSELQSQKDSLVHLLKNLSEENSIPYWDYSADSLCFQTKYLYNSTHLNNTGATIFSERIGNRINDLIEIVDKN
jgi:hypothetical protein